MSSPFFTSQRVCFQKYSILPVLSYHSFTSQFTLAIRILPLYSPETAKCSGLISAFHSSVTVDSADLSSSKWPAEYFPHRSSYSFSVVPPPFSIPQANKCVAFSGLQNLLKNGQSLWFVSLETCTLHGIDQGCS